MSALLRRVTGMTGAGSLALALLAGGCVLAATAGPRQAQATGMKAVEQTVDELTPADKTIVVSTSWTQLSSALSLSTGLYAPDLSLASAEEAGTQLHRDFSDGPLPLAPQSADWVGLNPGLNNVLTTVPSLDGIPAQLEITYRYPVAGHVRLVAGSMPGSAPPPTVTSSREIYNFQVVVTPQTASRFGLRPGSRLSVNTPLNVSAPGKLTGALLDVTGIVEPADPDSSFWTADPLLPKPALSRAGGGETWEAAVIADPGEFAMVEQVFGQTGLNFQWELPTGTTGLHSQAPALYDQANQIANQTPVITGKLAPMATALSVAFGLVPPLSAFVQAENDANALLMIVYAGLALAGLVTLFLTARMTAARRQAELTLRRARGASLRQLFWLGTRGAAVACLPAAALGWAAAVLLLPGDAPAGAGAWWPGIATLAVAVAGPGAVAAWQHRLPRRQGGRRRWRWLPRVVFEVTACAAAAGGITVFRSQTGGTDLYVSLAPVLVAVPAVIVTLRLYQVVLHWLARASARRRGVIGFLGLTRAAQAPLTLALPAVTLVLALTVAAFTGMVRAAVSSAETVASWQATGADAVVAASTGAGLSPATVTAVAAVPGVTHAAAVRVVPLTVDGNAELLTAVIVDPASYAALAAATEGFSPVRAALLSQAPGQDETPVLASPQAAAYLGGGAGTAIQAQGGVPTLRVRVAGQLRSTQAVPEGGAFVVLPQSALTGGVAPPPPVNLMLVTGPSMDMTRLSAVVQGTGAGAYPATVTTRPAALAALTGAPLQQGTFLVFALAVAFAAALALAVMLLELALGAADREVTTARLATMGLGEGQRVRLVALEVVPSAAAAAVAAAACAAALPRLLASAVDLSVFTQSTAPVTLRPDLAAFLLPLAALLVITVVALACEVRSGRGRGVVVTMRT
jgi:putative ABC transport system permease protein